MTNVAAQPTGERSLRTVAVDDNGGPRRLPEQIQNLSAR